MQGWLSPYPYLRKKKSFSVRVLDSCITNKLFPSLQGLLFHPVPFQIDDDIRIAMLKGHIIRPNLPFRPGTFHIHTHTHMPFLKRRTSTRLFNVPRFSLHPRVTGTTRDGRNIYSLSLLTHVVETAHSFFHFRHLLFFFFPCLVQRMVFFELTHAVG